MKKSIVIFLSRGSNEVTTQPLQREGTRLLPKTGISCIPVQLIILPQAFESGHQQAGGSADPGTQVVSGYLMMAMLSGIVCSNHLRWSAHGRSTTWSGKDTHERSSDTVPRRNYSMLSSTAYSKPDTAATSLSDKSCGSIRDQGFTTGCPTCYCNCDNKIILS